MALRKLWWNDTRRLLVCLTLTLVVAPAATGQDIRINGELVGQCGGNLDLSPVQEIVEGAQILRLQGTEGDCASAARFALATQVAQTADTTVFVLPIGLFEAVWLEEAIRSGDTSFLTVYRVWQRNAVMTDGIASVVDAGAALGGGLVRYHAAGKTLFGERLLKTFSGLSTAERETINGIVGGRARLRDMPTAQRTEASALIESLSHRAEDPQLQQFLANYLMFIELETLRAQEADTHALEVREKAANLQWFVDSLPETGRILYWEGRGALEEFPISTAVRVLRVIVE